MGQSRVAGRTWAASRTPSLWKLLVVAAIVIAGLIGAASASASTTCRPSINPPGTPAAGIVVAPGLRVISTLWGNGTCPGFFVSSRAPNGTIWVSSYDNTLWKSTDDMRTLQRTYVATGYVRVEQALQLASGTVLIEVRDANGDAHILRSTDASGTSFTDVLKLPPGSSLHDSNSWVEVNGTVYIGQYSGGPPVNLYKSTNDGQTWSVVWQGTNSDEIHAVQADPYVAGRIWVMTDGLEKRVRGTAVGYSDDGGQTFTWVTHGSYPESRVVDLMFAPDAVYWGTDSPDVPAGLFRYDRAAGQVTQLLGNLNGPFYVAVGYNGQFAQFSIVPSSEYIGDQNIHILTNGAGSSWSVTTSPWSRDPGNPAQNALTVGNTQPDSQGRFWVGYYDLAGSPHLDANLEFQFDQCAQLSAATNPLAAPCTSPTVGTPPIGSPPTGSPPGGSRPVVANARDTNKVWVEGNARPRISRKRKHPVGTVFSFTLNQTASVEFAFLHAVPGRMVARKCVARTSRDSHKRRCTLFVPAGTLTLTGHAGVNKVGFQGRLPTKRMLKLGAYRVVITATNSAGAKSTPTTLSFTIVKR